MSGRDQEFKRALARLERQNYLNAQASMAMYQAAHPERVHHECPRPVAVAGSTSVCGKCGVSMVRRSDGTIYVESYRGGQGQIVTSENAVRFEVYSADGTRFFIHSGPGGTGSPNTAEVRAERMYEEAIIAQQQSRDRLREASEKRQAMEAAEAKRRKEEEGITAWVDEPYETTRKTIRHSRVIAMTALLFGAAILLQDMDPEAGGVTALLAALFSVIVAIAWAFQPKITVEKGVRQRKVTYRTKPELYCYYRAEFIKGPGMRWDMFDKMRDNVTLRPQDGPL